MTATQYERAAGAMAVLLAAWWETMPPIDTEPGDEPEQAPNYEPGVTRPAASTDAAGHR